MKVGDRVRIISADYDEFQEFVGKLAIVHNVWDDDDVDLKIDGQPDNVFYMFNPSQVEHLDKS